MMFSDPPGTRGVQQSIANGKRDMQNPRVLLFSFCLAIGALVVGLPPAFGQELRRILYGTTASPAHLPVWVAKDAGYFDKYGFNVEPVQIRGGSLIALAIITGDLPFSGVGAESVVAARAAGGDVALLACPLTRTPSI